MTIDLPTTIEKNGEGKEYHAFNSGSTEREVGEFLYGLTRLIKPDHVLESGTYFGISSSFIATALKENGFGKLDTLEIESKHIEKAKELWNNLDLLQWITSYHQSSLDFQPTHNYQFIFLDTDPPIRFFELVKFYPFLDEGGYIFIHDLPYTMTQGNVNPEHLDFPSWPYGPIPEKMKQWLLNEQLIPFFFPNPRGMGGFYKPKKEEKVWREYVKKTL